MEAALNFAGYEVTNMWQEGGHDGKQATAIFADGMRWLWKGWPEPVKRGRSANDMLIAMIDTAESWRDAGEYSSLSARSGNIVLLPDGNQYILRGGTLCYKSKGKITVADKDDNLGDALAVSPDKRQLVVSGRRSHWLYDYIIQSDGKLADKQRLYWLHNPGNDEISDVHSMAFDTNGNLYVATALGVQVCDQNGRVRAILSMPVGAISTLWFGGEKLDTLFVVCGNKVYKRKLKTSGSVSAQKAIIPKSQGAG